MSRRRARRHLCRRLSPVATAALALALVPAPTAGAAGPRPGVFAGSLGVKIPAGGHAAVRAIDRSNGVIADAQTTGRNGRFSFTLPPGAYAVAGSVVSRTGRRTVQPSSASR